MFRYIIFLFIFQLSILNMITAQSGLNANITYIGNEGFMISNNGVKVFTDALFQHYNPGSTVISIDSDVENMLIAGSGVFSNSRLFLVSHNHSDHFNTEKVQAFLVNNPDVKLVCTPLVAGYIHDNSLKDRIISLKADQNKFIDTLINEVPLTVYNLRHDVLFSTDYNSGNLLNLDGFKVLHGGDTVLDDTTAIKEYKLYEKNIDVVLLAKNSWKTIQKRELIRKYIQPKYIILMHVSPDSVDAVKERTINEDPPIFVFRNSLDELEINENGCNMITTATRKIKKEGSVEVFPTIFNKGVYIKNIDSESNVSVFSISGILIKKISIEDPISEVDLSELNEGSYILRIEGKNSWNSKVIMKCNH
jgi:L-ascorbate metabolism protein UlaG (beta-lactamase superfamily)